MTLVAAERFTKAPRIQEWVQVAGVKTVRPVTCRYGSAPYVGLVPRDLKTNLQWRLMLTDMWAGNPDVQHDLWVMCKRDVLFWTNAFVYTFNPNRHPKDGPKLLPFITWGFQDEAMLAVQQCIIERRECLFEKSRDMGASWISLVVLLHRFLFHRYEDIGIASRTQDLVDKRGDRDCLFAKLDMVLDRLPGWMRPLSSGFSRKKLQFSNGGMGTTIEGYSTADDLGRGGRRTVMFMDEFASVPHSFAVQGSIVSVSDAIIYNSTPKGISNAFFQRVQSPDVLKIRMHWSQHPEKNPGLYTSDDHGRLRILDESYSFEPDYPFVLDGKLRSPWYDKTRRRMTDQQAAQELDIEYHGSGSAFFDNELLESHKTRYAIDPVIRGELDFDPATGQEEGFSDRSGGRFLLWTALSGWRPPPGDYIVGCDISTGAGASNSALSVVDKETGEKVAEFADPSMPPESFAALAVAVCHWFHEAMLIWEVNGPGMAFGRRVARLSYTYVYMRVNDESIKGRRSDRPGWHSSSKTKTVLLSDYRDALATGEFVNRSALALSDASGYVYQGDSIVHSQSLVCEDPSGARANHGDRCIADALCCKLLGAIMRQRAEKKRRPPPDSIGSRIEAWEAEQEEKRVRSWRDL